MGLTCTIRSRFTRVLSDHHGDDRDLAGVSEPLDAGRAAGLPTRSSADNRRSCSNRFASASLSVIRASRPAAIRAVTGRALARAAFPANHTSSRHDRTCFLRLRSGRGKVTWPPRSAVAATEPAAGAPKHKPRLTMATAAARRAEILVLFLRWIVPEQAGRGFTRSGCL